MGTQYLCAVLVRRIINLDCRAGRKFPDDMQLCEKEKKKKIKSIPGTRYSWFANRKLKFVSSNMSTPAHTTTRYPPNPVVISHNVIPGSQVAGAAVTVCLSVATSHIQRQRGHRLSWSWNGPRGSWLPEPRMLSCGQHSAREGSLLSIK